MHPERDLISGTLFEHAYEAAYVMDPEHDRILAANEAGCALLGYTRAELLETPISRIHPAELPELTELLERVLREGRASTIKLTCRTKLGTFLPTEISLHVLEIDDRIRILGLVRDRSEHRQPHPDQLATRSTASARTAANATLGGTEISAGPRRPLPPCWGAPATGEREPSYEIVWYQGPRAPLRDLFELAEDSSLQLDGYIDLGRVLVAVDDVGEIVGHLQLIPTAGADIVEIKSLAVRPGRQRRGVGRRLVEHALGVCRAERAGAVTVTTAAVDTGNLRFYQRCGFRVTSIEQDAFTPAKGYPPNLTVDGIPVRDSIRLTIELRPIDATDPT